MYVELDTETDSFYTLLEPHNHGTLEHNGAQYHIQQISTKTPDLLSKQIMQIGVDVVGANINTTGTATMRWGGKELEYELKFKTEIEEKGNSLNLEIEQKNNGEGGLSITGNHRYDTENEMLVKK